MSQAKMRHCCNCGAELGVIEARFYDRSDTCGSPQCDREVREWAQEEREQAHRDLDDSMGW